MKYIRECRMGRPKSFKTGAVVGSYPKPMLYFQFDQDGISILPDKKNEQFDTGYSEVAFVEPEADKVLSSTAPIVCVDFTKYMPHALSNEFKPESATLGQDKFLQLYMGMIGKPFPFKTAVFDGLTGYTDILFTALASKNPGSLANAMQWAPLLGQFIRKTIISFNQLPCHTVMLLHSVIDKDELTGIVSENPNLYSKGLRDDVFGLFSQCFYSLIDAQGNPKVYTSDKYPVKGIGCRWPQGLSKEMNPDFKSIYGKELGLC